LVFLRNAFYEWNNNTKQPIKLRSFGLTYTTHRPGT
jgi:hypothetical protein